MLIILIPVWLIILGIIMYIPISCAQERRRAQENAERRNQYYAASADRRSKLKQTADNLYLKFENETDALRKSEWKRQYEQARAQYDAFMHELKRNEPDFDQPNSKRPL